MRFDMLAAAYDAMIDWDKRLANEAPFYREIFSLAGVGSVLDAACGTGRHAALFASWGLRVQGADLNAAMIDHCREAHGTTPNLTFTVRGFTEPPSASFDAVLCIGNSLSLVDDAEQADAAIAAMASAINPGGVLIVQVMNLHVREDGPVRWEKTRRHQLGVKDYLIVKGTHRSGDHGSVDFIVADLDQSPPVLTTDSVRLVALDAQRLEQACERAGLHAVTCYGDYRKSRYNQGTSGDLILVARAR